MKIFHFTWQLFAFLKLLFSNEFNQNQKTIFFTKVISDEVLWQNCVIIWLLWTLSISNSCQHVMQFITSIYLCPVTFSQIIQRVKTLVFLFFSSLFRKGQIKTKEWQNENSENRVISNYLWKRFSFVFDYHIHESPRIHLGILKV